MVQRVELQFYIADAEAVDVEDALARLPVFKDAEKTRNVQRSQRVQTGLGDWDICVNTRGASCTLVAVHREWPLGHAIEVDVEQGDWRSRIASESELKSVEHALGESSNSGDATLDEEVEAQCVEWTDVGGVGVRATLQGSSMLTLSAPPEACESIFRIAREVVDALAFVIAPFMFDRTLGDAVKAEKLRLSKKDSPTDAFAKMGCSVAQHWFGNDAAARVRMGVEQVHQLRVAQRRLKTALKLFPEWLDDDWRTNIAPDLEWYGDLLGDARDWDVFTDTQLPAYAAADQESRRKTWQQPQNAADKKRLAARDALSQALRSPRYARLALAYVTWFSRLEEPAKAGHTKLAAHARKRIRKHYRKIEGAPDLTTLDTHTRHRLRIHAKRLRYALEFYRSLVTRRTRESVAQKLGEFQSVLGEGNDAAVAAQRLEMLDEASDYQKGLAQGLAAAAQRDSAGEGEQILRKIKTPRLKASL